jgi:2,4-dienoyl-CoA reductase-like NADH-dependent reductase (Old Yellow Enzyme family)
MSPPRIPKLRRLRTAEAFREHLAAQDIELAFDDVLAPASESPLAGGLDVAGQRVGNRFAMLPMEGWDSTRDGRPSELVRRRWRRFGASGAKLVWGGEAVAVRPDGRANPNQLVSSDATTRGLAELRSGLVEEHERCHGTSHDLLVGLQLTHSGRFARPDGSPAPRVAYRHPLLDARVGVSSDAALLSDEELDDLVQDFAAAAGRAARAGFGFVDVKHCHGYLLHELLSGVERPGRYGGDFEGRTRFLKNVVAAIRTIVPELALAVRLSIFDFVPFRAGEDQRGEPERWEHGPWPYAFGGDGSGLGIDLAEPSRFLDLAAALGIDLICTTAGSPYTNPHIQRPAYFPPSDGYLPPEDPLAGVARQIAATAELKRRHPDLVVVGSGYSYLQEWLPNVAQRSVREGAVDLVGLGRMALSYPELPADVLAGRPLDGKRLCRTFSDCTTAPRNGLVSGCYPLDPFYKERPEHSRLLEIKVQKARAASPSLTPSREAP